MAAALGRALAIMVGLKAEFLKSVSGALWRRTLPIEFGFAVIAFGWPP